MLSKLPRATLRTLTPTPRIGNWAPLEVIPSDARASIKFGFPISRDFRYRDQLPYLYVENYGGGEKPEGFLKTGLGIGVEVPEEWENLCYGPIHPQGPLPFELEPSLKEYLTRYEHYGKSAMQTLFTMHPLHAYMNSSRLWLGQTQSHHPDPEGQLEELMGKGVEGWVRKTPSSSYQLQDLIGFYLLVRMGRPSIPGDSSG